MKNISKLILFGAALTALALPGPAIDGAFVLTSRGGDFELTIGKDVSIGYLSHTDSVVRLYLEEAFTFRVLTSESSVALSASAAKAAK